MWSHLPSVSSAAPFRAGRRLFRGRHPGYGRGISRAAWLVHLVGAMALFAGLLLPLTDIGQALANPALARQQAQQRAMQDTGQGGDVPTIPTQVVAVGDFQNQLGCTDFDATCTATQLSPSEGIWTGVFPISPGTYEVQFIATAQDGQQSAGPSDPAQAWLMVWRSPAATARPPRGRQPCRPAGTARRSSPSSPGG